MENLSSNPTSTNSDNFIPGVEASKRKFFVYSILLIVLVALLGAGYFIYKTGKFYDVQPNIKQEEVAKVPKGFIILSATKDGWPAVYTLDLDVPGAIPEKFPAFQITTYPEFTDKINPRIVYYTAATEYSVDEPDLTGLHSWEISSTTTPYYKSAVGNTELDLNWSQAQQKLAYFRIKSDKPESIIIPRIDDYEIVILDPNKDEVTMKIDSAVYPRWSPTGESMIFFRKDGLYELNFSTGEETNVMSPDQPGVQLTPSEKIDVSPNGKKMIITSQNSGLISVFNIKSWNPINLELDYTYQDETVHFTSPLFSPENNMYALFAMDRRGVDYSNPRLEIRDINSADILYSLDLFGFDMTRFTISDWVSTTIHPMVKEVETTASTTLDSE